MQMKVSNINMCAKAMFIGTSLWLLSLLSALQAFAQNRNMTIEKRIQAKGLAIMENGFELHPYEFTRHAVGDKDIEVKVLYAAICHSDLHEATEDWYKGHFPFVPGHETIGKVVRVGKKVTRFKVGDYAGIGPTIQSCHECQACKEGRDNYCEKMISSYNSVDYYHGGEITQGGYSTVNVVDEDYAYVIPQGTDIKRVAPLLCAGVTTWYPLHHLMSIRHGDKVAVAGFGGLGHLAVKYAIDLGAEVTVFDITEDKRADAFRLGAKKYVNVNNAEELQGMDGMFDAVVSTIPSHYDLMMYLAMVKYGGSLCILGAPATKDMPQISLTNLIWNGGKKVFASMDGSVSETQQCIDYSVAHGIYPDVEVIPAVAEVVSNAFHKVKEGKVKFRYVIDMTTMK